MTARKLTRTAGVVLAAIPVALVAWASTGAATTGSSVLPHYGAKPTNTVGVDSNSTSGVGGHAIGGTSGSRTVHATDTQTLAAQLAAGRLATAKYATNVNRAKQDGYMIITRDIPDMGWHFLNPRATGFDIRRPPILVYTKRGSSWQLVAFEWVFPKQPTARPLPGATYGAFGAACHYKDGTFVFETNQSACTSTSPQTGAAFNFWHPGLVTLHVWLWYPNPAGLYAGTNPLMRPFNGL